MAAARAVHDLIAGCKVGDRFRDESLLEDAPGGLDPVLPRPARGLGFGDDPRPGPGERRIAEQLAGLRQPPARQIDGSGSRPFLPEQRFHRGDGCDRMADKRVAAARRIRWRGAAAARGPWCRSRARSTARHRPLPARRSPAGRCPGTMSRPSPRKAPIRSPPQAPAPGRIRPGAAARPRSRPAPACRRRGRSDAARPLAARSRRPPPHRRRCRPLPARPWRSPTPASGSRRQRRRFRGFRGVS